MIRTLILLSFLACAPSTLPPKPAATPSTEIHRSPLDQRTYRHIELPNGLRAVVVHDDNTDKAAAALSVRIGHFADPAERQGLTHFLEHMLFMGTDTYPDVDDYRKFIQSHGGGTNAGTGTESTTYYFDIEHSFFKPALDRFSRFFVAPKLDPEYVDRERNAVNSEYSLKIKDDVRRIREVKKKTRNPAHPYSKFSVGNLDFLGDHPNSPSLHEDLVAHYKQFYRANIMTLTVIGRESLDDLEALVRKKFADVPPADTTLQPPPIPPYLPEQLGVEIRIKPIKSQRRLELIFPAPPNAALIREKPVRLLLHLLGDEGQGSLYAELKKRGWVESLHTAEDGAIDFSLLETYIDLTEEGYAHRDEVVTLFFQYVDLLRDPAELERIFTEQRTLHELSFNFREETPAAQLVQSISRSLPLVPTEHVLDHNDLYTHFDATTLSTFVDALTPENLRLIVVADDVHTDTIEPLYNTPYRIEPLSSERLHGFASHSVEADLALPEPNPYIPTNTSLISTPTTAPTLLDVGVPNLTLWHAPDTEFKVPRAHVGITIHSTPVHTRRDRALLALYLRLLNDSLEALRYPLQQAGLSIHLSPTDSGVYLTLSGYSEKQARVMRDLVRAISSFQIDPTRFKLEAEELARDLDNEQRGRPIRQALNTHSTLLRPHRLSSRDGAEMVRSFTVKDLQTLTESLWTHTQAVGLIHGNLDVDGATAVARALQPLITDAPSMGTAVIRKLPQGSITVHKQIEHDDSTLLVYYQTLGATDTATHAKFLLLASLLRTPFFTELRTKEQLGYVVFAAPRRLDTVPGFLFGIQSSSAGPQHLLERTQVFILDRPAAIRSLTDDAFETEKKGRISSLLEAETRLSQRSSRYQHELELGFSSFDRRQALADAVSELTKEEMARFAETLFGSNAHKLILRSQGAAHTDAPLSPADCDADTCEILNDLPLYTRQY